MLVLVILEGVVLALLAVLVVALLRSHAEILRRLHELGAGVYGDAEPAAGPGAAMRTRPGVSGPRGATTPAFDITGTSPAGSTMVVGVLDRPHTTLIAFLSSGCLTCADFWHSFADGAGGQLPGRDTNLVIVTKGPEAESRSAVQQLAEGQARTVMSTQAWIDYQVPVSPYFVLVDGVSGQVIGEGSGASWTQVASLLEQACADAGLAGSPSGRPARLNGPARERRADDELRRAGIGPGHPSLYGAAGQSDAPSSASTRTASSQPDAPSPDGPA